MAEVKRKTLSAEPPNTSSKVKEYTQASSRHGLAKEPPNTLNPHGGTVSATHEPIAHDDGPSPEQLGEGHTAILRKRSNQNTA